MPEPTFQQKYQWARAHQRSAGESDSPPSVVTAKPVDQADGRNPFYRPPIVIPADAPDNGNPLG